MASRLKNRPGLRLDLNMKAPNLPPVDLLKPSSSTGTSTTTATNNWREDLARMVSKNKSMTDISEAALDPSLPVSDNNNNSGSNKGDDDGEEDLKSEDMANLQKLGEGAAGTVWKVKHKPSGKIMAKKVSNTASVELLLIGCVCVCMFVC
jgi:mitogen-activated protein kinase kinase